MKITLSIYENELLEITAKEIDAALLMSKYSYIYNDKLDLDEAIKQCKKNNVEAIISITKVFVENELDDIKNFILKYKDNKFLISDLGIAQYMIEMGLKDKIIYHPDTLICNSLDVNNFASFNFHALGISNEITISDLKTILDKCKVRVFYQVFGRKIMFYSRRKLLHLYKNHYKLDFKNENLSLVEEMRNSHIPFLENDNGFYCFRPYYISALKEINNIKDIAYSYFDSYDLKSEQVLFVLTNFKSLSPSEINDVLNASGINVEDGFNYNDTAYVKEKMFNE